MNDLAALDHRHLWHPFTQQSEWTATPPLIVDRAEGCWLIDVDGQRYLDGVSSLWTNVHGHRHPVLDRALRDQLDRVAHSTMLGLTHTPAILLAARLAQVAPPGLTRTFFSDNGSTAVEVALKIAYQTHRQRGDLGRTHFAALDGAYHGDTVGAVSLGAIPLFHAAYKPLLFDAVALPAPVNAGGDEEARCLHAALDALDAVGPTLAALVIEPLCQGAAGIKRHSPAFAAALAERARKHGALVVYDEVAVGFGRTGTLFASEQVGVAPDLLAVAKGLGAGYLPIAATLTTEAVYEAFLGPFDAWRQLFHGHTFTGNPLAAAVALASLDLFETEGTLQRVAAIERRFARRFEVWRTSPRVADIRQLGVIAGIDLLAADGSEAPPSARLGHRVAMACRRHGAIVRPLGNTLVLNPPLSLSDGEADLLLDAVEAALREAP